MNLQLWVEVPDVVGTSEAALAILDLQAYREQPDGFAIQRREVGDSSTPGHKIVYWVMEDVRGIR